MRENKRVEEIKLLSEIDQAIVEWEDEDSAQIYELRKRIFIVHAMVERSLNMRILEILFRSITPSSVDYKSLTENDFIDWAMAMGNIVEASDSMRFSQKLEYTFKLGGLEPPEYSELKKFNKLRNSLAHPSIKINDRKDYKKINYLDALTLIRRATVVVHRSDFKWFDELDENMSKSMLK